MRILKEETAAVLIDVQSKLFPHIANSDDLLAQSIKLIKGLKALNIPILVTEQYPKGLGATLPELIEALGDSYNPIEKMSFSVCGSAEFMLALKETHRYNLIVAGIEAHVCVQQTILDLSEKYVNPVLIQDCISSRNENDKSVAVDRMKTLGITLATAESILFEMCRSAEAPEFKTISKIVK